MQSPGTRSAWAGILEDGGLLQPDATTTTETVEAHRTLRADADGLVGALAVRDTDLPALRGTDVPVRIVLTTGAGGVVGTLGLAHRLGLPVQALQVSLRDTDDLVGNVRRVVVAADAARDEGVLDDDVRIHVDVPTDLPGGLDGSWARAADEVAAAELALHLRTEGPVEVSPEEVARWIDAALDRETPFSVQAPAAVSDQGRLGVVNLLLATRQAFDGADPTTVTATLAGAAPTEVLSAARAEEYLPGARRWLTSVVVSDAATVAEALSSTGLPNGS